MQDFKSEISVTRLCDGCPAQGNFLGSIAAQRAEIIIQGPTTYNDDVTARVQFVDHDGGKSEEVVSDLPHAVSKRGAGFEPQSKLSRSGVARVAAEAKDRAEHATVEVIARVRQCESVAIDAAGRRHCPALDSKIFDLMLRRAYAQGNT